MATKKINNSEELVFQDDVPLKRRPGRPRIVTTQCVISGVVLEPTDPFKVIEVMLQTPQKFRDIVCAFKCFGAKEVHMIFYSDFMVLVGECAPKAHSEQRPSCMYLKFPVESLCRYYVQRPGMSVSLSRTNLDALCKKVTTAHENLCISVFRAEATKSVSFHTTQQHGQKTATWTYNQITTELIRIPPPPPIPPMTVLGVPPETDGKKKLAAQVLPPPAAALGVPPETDGKKKLAVHPPLVAEGGPATPPAQLVMLAPNSPRIEPYRLRWGGDLHLLKGITRDIHTQTALECVRFSADAAANVLQYSLLSPRLDQHGMSTIRGTHCSMQVSPGCIVQNTFYASHVSVLGPLMRRTHKIKFFMDSTRPMIAILIPFSYKDDEEENLLDAMTAIILAETVGVD